MIVIQLDKYYSRRDGKIAGPMQPHEDDKYSFYDPAHKIGYPKEGWYTLDQESPKDLIKEVPIPTPNEIFEKSIPPTTNEIFEESIRPKATSKAASDKSGTGISLIPLRSLFDLGKIFIEGLRYGRDNWKKGVNDKEYQEERLEHALVHLIKWKEGDRTEPHLAKVAWFCFTQLELERLEKETNG
jgi:hypothetical protein